MMVKRKNDQFALLLSLLLFVMMSFFWMGCKPKSQPTPVSKPVPDSQPSPQPPPSSIVKKKENPEKTIEALLQLIANSEITLIRNDEEMNSLEASRHIRNKYEYYQREIKTPEDFIAQIGSRSIVSGKAYEIKTKEGKVLRLDEWLTQLLKEYREKEGLEPVQADLQPLSQPASSPSVENKENSEKTIEALLQLIANSEITLIRNDEVMNSLEASRHIRDKYEYYRHQIKTPEDFIAQIGSRSIVSGKAYEIKTKEGKVLRLDEWLTQLLKEYREKEGRNRVP